MAWPWVAESRHAKGVKSRVWGCPWSSRTGVGPWSHVRDIQSSGPAGFCLFLSNVPVSGGGEGLTSLWVKTLGHTSFIGRGEAGSHYVPSTYSNGFVSPQWESPVGLGRGMWKGMEVLRECGLEEKAEGKVPPAQFGLGGEKGLRWGPDGQL